MNIPNKNELTRIYGEAEKSAARFQAVADHLAEIYHHDIAEFFTAPGRTEIIGNHTDHNGGRVIAGSIDMDTIGAAYPNNSSVYHPVFTLNGIQCRERSFCQSFLVFP